MTNTTQPNDDKSEPSVLVVGIWKALADPWFTKTSFIISIVVLVLAPGNGHTTPITFVVTCAAIAPILAVSLVVFAIDCHRIDVERRIEYLIDAARQDEAAQWIAAWHRIEAERNA